MAEAKDCCLTDVVPGNGHKGIARFHILPFFFLTMKDISHFVKKDCFKARHSHMRQPSGFRNSSASW